MVDDDDDFRFTTARILDQHGYSCVEAASSAAARLVLAAQPDVAIVLCDITMPGESGIELLAELTVEFPDVAVVMTTGLDDPRVAEAAFDRGAYGYVVKPWDTNELLISLDSALRRRDHESSQRERVRTLEQTVAGIESNGELRDETLPSQGGVGAGLTTRERQILGLIAAGLSNKQIAQHLGVTLNTVRNHVRNTLAKLGVHSRLQAVATAMQEGLVTYPAR
ncbi:MAG: response regulator transcription factor [Acidimicrobiales bacterium]